MANNMTFILLLVYLVCVIFIVRHSELPAYFIDMSIKTQQYMQMTAIFAFLELMYLEILFELLVQCCGTLLNPLSRCCQILISSTSRRGYTIGDVGDASPTSQSTVFFNTISYLCDGTEKSFIHAFLSFSKLISSIRHVVTFCINRSAFCSLII